MRSRAPILHSSLPLRPWEGPQGLRLPGVSPVPQQDWLVQDEVFAAQMAYRDELVATRGEDVIGLEEGAGDIARELMDEVLAALARSEGYSVSETHVHRPDDCEVTLDVNRPLQTCGRLVQEDLLLLRQEGQAHRLVGGVVCFPALWRLDEKLGRSLLSVHAPVATYTEDLSGRVERILVAVRPGQVLMRTNLLIYENPDLHQPATEGTTKPLLPGSPRYVRVQRQPFRRLPRTRAVVFGIHTYLVDAADLSTSERAELSRIRPSLIA